MMIALLIIKYTYLTTLPTTLDHVYSRNYSEEMFITFVCLVSTVLSN